MSGPVDGCYEFTVIAVDLIYISGFQWQAPIKKVQQQVLRRVDATEIQASALPPTE